MVADHFDKFLLRTIDVSLMLFDVGVGKMMRNSYSIFTAG
jgi:hypothetical protein